MKRLMISVASASLIALSGSVAAEPVELSSANLDRVTAGATAGFNFTTAAVGDWGTQSGANVSAEAIAGNYAVVGLSAGSVAQSVLDPASSSTSGSIGTSLP